jgi:hypothetical protein
MNNEKKIKILAGITNDNELYFLNITTERDDKPYFSMSDDTHTPITVEDAKQRQEDSLDSSEMEYFWREAVQAERTTDSLKDWIEQVRNEQGETDAVDNSIFNITVEVDGEEYIFESQSCGQHEEKTLKHYFISQNDFKMLLKAWELYHMKDIDVNQIVLPMPYNGVSVGYMLEHLPKQNIEALSMQAITIINSEY